MGRRYIPTEEQEINDPWNEMDLWDYVDDDCPPEDTNEWWREQDAELEAQDLARIEVQVEIEELRHNGYWD